MVNVREAERKEAFFEEKQQKEELEELNKAREILHAVCHISFMIKESTTGLSHQPTLEKATRFILNKLKAAEMNISLSKKHERRVSKAARMMLSQARRIGLNVLKEDEKRILSECANFDRILKRHLDQVRELIKAAEQINLLIESKPNRAVIKEKFEFIYAKALSTGGQMINDVSIAKDLLQKADQARRSANQ
ncbi:hypothetical protein JXB11_02235 [Candidatus Woesearchaeota archaeon]|nr:hypothetical protein [Candidatus Woesearchaeota archaeon]